MTMPKRLEGVLWIAVGVVICVLSRRTGIGTFTEPGAGFVAMVSGLFLIAVGSIMSVVRKETGDGQGKPRAPERLQKLFLTTALLILYGLFLEPLGYVLTTFLFMLGLFRDLGRRRFAAPFFASLASVALTYALFEIWLKVRFPRGVFPWW
jgi:putative tricarboxylic transport membrane protein